MALAGFGKKFVSILRPHIIPSHYPLAAAAAVTSSISMRGRNISSQGSLISRLAEELEGLAEEQRIIMGAPEWMPFLPGSSYWLPASEDYKRLLFKQEQEDEDEDEEEDEDEDEEDEAKEMVRPRDTAYLVLLDSSSDSEN